MTLWASQQDAPGLNRPNLIFVLKLFALLIVALAAMRWIGPLTVEALVADHDYRALRDERPWKYLGFLFGGTGLVAGLMALMEGHLTRRGLLVGLCATLALIALYDLPFEDLLLPPNGDV